jgi:hypothetical protein
MEPSVCFVSASGQNVFFGELLDAIADALADLGIDVERAVDYFPDLRDDLVYVFVPHELMPLLMPDAHPSEMQLRRSVTICTEQPGTHWFEESAEIAKRAAAAIDINRLGVAALGKLGVDARFMQIGYTPRWDRWHGEPNSERPIDVAVLAGATPRRLTAVGRCARHLAGRRTELHLPEALVPHQAGSDVFLSGNRSELGYFEWQRAIEAMANGCVFLSEHSLGFEPLIPGEHFVSVSYDSLDVALEALMDDEDRLAQMRVAAYELIRDELPLSSSVAVLAETVGEVVRLPISRDGPRDREPVPRPKRPQAPPPEYARIQRLLDQRETGNALPDLSTASEARSGEDVVEAWGVQAPTPPRVSVLLTVGDEASSVGAAVDSLSISDFTDYELVIVDDASRDGSGNQVRTALARAPWLHARLITRPHNGGRARARNLGAEVATGKLVLVLDAESTIYPHALGRLVGLVDANPAAAFAYGVVEELGVDGLSSLTSYLGWDPSRLRYGNFVDSTALVRRSALLEVGGYVTDPRLDGWEDLALWCAFADSGWDGVRVPEIVACHRMPLHPMASVANIDTSAAWSLLLDRFECLSD